jgi:hypothetical protein
MPPPVDPNNPPRVFIIQTPPRPTGPTLVLDYDQVPGSGSLVLRSNERPTPARQKFRVYTSGHIQNVEAGNVGFGDNGYLTRVPAGTTFQLRLRPYDTSYDPNIPDDPRWTQVWNFKAGPTPNPTPGLGDPARVPGGGPNGTEKFTIVVAGAGPSPPVLTAPDNAQPGQGVDVAPPQTPTGAIPGGVIPDDRTQRRLRDEQLYFFYWLPGD